MAPEAVPLATGVPTIELERDKHATSTDEKATHPTSEDSALNSDDEDIDGDYGSYHDHAFSNPKVAAYWRDVYENAQYEGRHRFDPSLTWSAKEEKALKRKVSAVT